MINKKGRKEAHRGSCERINQPAVYHKQRFIVKEVDRLTSLMIDGNKLKEAKRGFLEGINEPAVE